MIRLLYVLELTAPDRITASACVNDFVLAVLVTDWRVNSAANSHRSCRLSESDRVRDYISTISSESLRVIDDRKQTAELRLVFDECGVCVMNASDLRS